MVTKRITKRSVDALKCKTDKDRSFLWDDALAGFGVRPYNWEFSTSVQHEILPGVSVDVGYFRRWFGNFRVIDNLALAPSDFDQFSLTVPSDSRLPNGGGYTVTGLYNVKPEPFTLIARV